MQVLQKSIRKFDKSYQALTIARLFHLNQKKIGISFRGGRKKGFQRREETRRKHRLNAEIRVPEVRVVGEHGDEILGVMKTSDAIALSNERGVDLVEISPKADPPVCKLIDYGKMLYSLKKKEHQMKKATKARELKGIRLTFKIDVGDIERQRKMAEKFLLEGHPVRVVMKLRGREKAHTPLAIQKLRKFTESLSESGSLDQPPRAAGFQIITTLKPNAKTTSH